MDFDFYNEWETVGTAKVGRDLSAKLFKIKVLREAESLEETIPEGEEGAGDTIARYALEDRRYELAEGVSHLLGEECNVAVRRGNLSNISILYDILGYVLNTKITHFSIG